MADVSQATDEMGAAAAPTVPVKLLTLDQQITRLQGDLDAAGAEWQAADAQAEEARAAGATAESRKEQLADRRRQLQQMLSQAQATSERLAAERTRAREQLQGVDAYLATVRDALAKSLSQKDRQSLDKAAKESTARQAGLARRIEQAASALEDAGDRLAAAKQRASAAGRAEQAAQTALLQLPHRIRTVVEQARTIRQALQSALEANQFTEAHQLAHALEEQVNQVGALTSNGYEAGLLHKLKQLSEAHEQAQQDAQSAAADYAAAKETHAGALEALEAHQISHNGRQRPLS